MAMLRSLLLLFIVFSTGNAAGKPDKGRPCQYGWTNFETRCYKFFSQSATWIEAERNCIALSAHLASVNKEKENSFLLGLLPSPTTLCWIGVQDAVEEGEWLWSDGTNYDYNNWCTGEPNNLNVENCGEINWTSDECWNDSTCTNPKGYICATRSEMDWPTDPE
ncbi:C-type lectin domain-containing protein [Polaribacter sp. 20A6]|uniref:C-type lectin domain-containing protein n=1 Tax=Polaribacter sp. 20A6 TaxID=2687289 RepID=UPI0013FDFA51|nr:C-type lectin domain-containing protein [Polaribacter sp. 20A6]